MRNIKIKKITLILLIAFLFLSSSLLYLKNSQKNTTFYYNNNSLNNSENLQTEYNTENKLIKFDDINGNYNNDVMNISFKFDENYIINENPNLSSVSIYNENLENQPLIGISLINSILIEENTTIDDAINSTFEYWFSSTSQFDHDLEKPILIDKKEIFVKNSDKKSVKAYKFNISYENNEKKSVSWTFIPQYNTIDEQKAQTNYFKIIWITDNQTDSNLSKKVFDSLVIN